MIVNDRDGEEHCCLLRDCCIQCKKGERRRANGGMELSSLLFHCFQ